MDVVANRLPVAISGANQVVRVGAVVALDGRQSFDLDGDRLTYRWTLTAPSGSQAALDGTALVQPRFTADVAGSYVVRLVVNDGTVDSVARELTVQAHPPGAAPPTAVIAAPLVQPFGSGASASVQLDGSQSYDPDGDAISFAWQLTGRPATSTTAALTSTTGVAPKLIADKPGRYVVQLQVAAGGSTSASVQVTITLYQPNTQPTVDAGADRNVATSSLVTLAATATDANGDSLGLPSWAFVAMPFGSTATVAGETTLTPSFTADVEGDYLLELVVTDARGATGRARVLVRARGPADADQDGVPDISDACPGTAPSAPVDSKGCAAGQLPPVTISTLTANPASGPAPLSVNFMSQASGGTGSYTYSWQFGDNQTSTGQSPTHIYTVPNTYSAKVRATDTLGTFGEASATIAVSAPPPVNTAPIVTAGSAQTITLPGTATLSGSVSDDGLPNPPALVTLTWSKDSGPGNVTFGNANAKNTSAVFSAAGSYVLRLTANDGALAGFGTVNITVNPALPTNTAPIVNAGTDQTITLPTSASLSGTVTDDGLPNPPALVTLTWSKDSGPGNVTFGNANAKNTSAVFSAAGNYVLRLTANDGALAGFGTVNITVNPALPTNTAPIVNAGADQTITLPASASLSGTVTDDGLPNPPALVTLTWSKDSGPGNVTFGNANAKNTSAVFSAAGSYVLRLTANDGALVVFDTVTITLSSAPEEGLPPDPATVAPSLDLTVATTTFAATQFLYTGANPIQTGIAPGTIEPKRAAVLRGRVLDRQNTPLAGVTVDVLNHPELGQTLSRADGWFDLAVNGGGYLTLHYRRAGFLPAQRQVNAQWQGFAQAPDVALIPVDSQVTTIDLRPGVPWQVARGSAVSDPSGSRQATLLVPASTTATMALPDGTTQALASMNVRATEYTVGTNGPQAMPAELPPTSAYTYAIELSIDEAIAARAKSVTFNQPLPLYVDNFIGFPVGIQVPLAHYDRDKAAWVPSDDGRVIKVLSVANGIAEIDTTGDGSADNGVALGVTNAERQLLATLYPAGKTLSRIVATHFTPYDLNYGVVPAAGAQTPALQSPTTADGPQTHGPSITCSSIIECEHQTLGERIPLVGTGLTLNYRSDRMPGRTAAIYSVINNDALI